MINWSAIDRRSLAGRILRLPGRMLPASTVMHIRRGPARGLKWISGSSIHGCWLGTYELEKQVALRRFVATGMTVYDIGAQAGFYALFFSRLVGERGSVYAFEPCPYEARFLVEHVCINRLKNVRIIQAAVSDRRGLTGMTVNRGVTQNQLCDSAGTVLTVPALTLDGTDLPPPDLIKMDVEGAESAILTGAREMLGERQPVVFVALHGAVQRVACVTLLNTCGYSIHDLKGEPVSEESPVDEIYAIPPKSANP